MVVSSGDRPLAFERPILAPAPPGVPTHVAIIMDGNGRWATRRGLPRPMGHRAGTQNVTRIVEASLDIGIRVLTLYAFSTENWGRPQDEVSGLMKLFLEISRRETLNLHRQGVRIQHLGSLERTSAALRQAITDATALTQGNRRLVLNFAFDYGGRAEIVRAVQALLTHGMDANQITEQTISDALDTRGLPDPDLIIRTAGEMRLSNFLLWQAAYSEYYSSTKFWPDFDADDLRAATTAYSQRKRTFGHVPAPAAPGGA